MSPTDLAAIKATLAEDRAFFERNAYTNWHGDKWQSAFHRGMVDREKLIAAFIDLKNRSLAIRATSPHPDTPTEQ